MDPLNSIFDDMLVIRFKDIAEIIADFWIPS